MKMKIMKYFNNKYFKDLELLLLSFLISAIDGFPVNWFNGAIAFWIGLEIYLLNAEFHCQYSYSNNTKSWIKNCLSVHTIVILTSICIGSFIISFGSLMFSFIAAAILIAIYWFAHIVVVKK